MYNIKITYIDGKVEELDCEDWYYDEMGEVLTMETDRNNSDNITEIMVHQLRKIVVTERSENFE